MGIPRRSDVHLRPRRVLAWLVALAAFAMAAACSGSEEAGSADSTPAPDPDPVASAPVDAASPMPSAAPADSTVTGTDYAFDATDVSAGDAVALVNESDVEAHEMVVMEVTDDAVTLEEIQQLLAEDTDAPPPDFLEEAGFAFAMPGETSDQTVRFGQGRYLLLCFIPQNAPPETVAQMMESSEPPELPSDAGPPHVALGMVDLIEVE
jgi:plastocyanin